MPSTSYVVAPLFGQNLMHCDLPDDIAWPALLAARGALLRADGAVALVQRPDGTWICALDGAFPADGVQILEFRPTTTPPPPGPRRWSRYRTSRGGPGTFDHPDGQPVPAPTQAMARAYGPVLLGHAAAAASGQVFVVGHLTQTLDARIACARGGPQWLGNNGDRRHTHRMRALLDGVMVGAATATGDDPQLTVREVSGPNPRRLVLSGNGSVLRAPRPLRLFADHGADVLVAAGGVAPAVAGARVVAVDADNGILPPAGVLAALSRQGVRSLFLEGGARTLSSFLQAGCLDLLQIHVAPLVLGSGVPSFQLPAVASFREGHHLCVDHVQVGSDLMFVCWPQGTH